MGFLALRYGYTFGYGMGMIIGDAGIEPASTLMHLSD